MGWVPVTGRTRPWFHAICAMVEVGAVLLPGNMGRIIRLYDANSPRLNLENDFEAMRQEIDPELPSRLSCIFLCPTLDDALAFAATDAPLLCQWYEVEPIQKPERIFVTDFRNWPQPSSQDGNRKAARRYWTDQSGDSHQEILFPTAVRVTSILPAMVDITAEFARTNEGKARLEAAGLRVE